MPLPSGRRLCLVALSLTLAFAATAASPAGARTRDPLAAALTAAPSTLTPAALLALQTPNRPKDSAVEVILLHDTLRFDSQGRVTHERHAIYRVLTDEGVRGWETVSGSYLPFHQDKPTIFARVVTPDGQEHKLDPATLVVAGGGKVDGQYGDRRTVTGPLPALVPGSVVEEWITVRENRPYFAGGSAWRHIFYSSVYAAAMRLRIEAPDGLGLDPKLSGSARALDRSSQGGVTTWTFLERDVLPFEDGIPAGDPSVPRVPTVDVATGKSWGAVASAYAAEVDKQIAGFDTAPLLKTLPATATPEQKLWALVALVHARVRYVALELGEASLIPNPIGNTLQRRYGDCKDKGTLLVALLRAAGIEAHLALLRTGPGFDVHRGAPGLGRFNHAIVRATLPDGGERWIDATAVHAAPGVLTSSVQGRLALIASPKARDLVTIPRAPADQTTRVEHIVVQFQQADGAKVRETTRSTGLDAASLRSDFSETDKPLEEVVSGYVKETYQGRVVRAKTRNLEVGPQPYELEIEIEASDAYSTYDDGGRFEVTPNGLYGRLPELFYSKPEAPKDEVLEALAADGPPRFRKVPKMPVLVPYAHRAEIVYEFEIPDGFHWHSLPEGDKKAAHGFEVSAVVEKKDDRHLVVRYALRVDAAHVAPEALPAVQELLSDFEEASTLELQFSGVAADLQARFDIVGAVEADRGLLARNPDDVVVHTRVAHRLTTFGFGVAGRALADKAAARWPKSALAHKIRGLVYLYDTIGRDNALGQDREEAEQALRVASLLDPDDTYSLRLLDLVLRPACVAKPKVEPKCTAELTRIRERIAKEDPSYEPKVLVHQYVLEGRLDKASAAVEKMPEGSARDAVVVTLTAMKKGAKAAERKARALGREKASTLIAGAAVVAYAMRDLKTTAAIARLPSVARANPLIATLFGRLDQAAVCLSEKPAAVQHVLAWARGVASRPIDVDVEAVTEASAPPAFPASAYSEAYEELLKSADIYQGKLKRLGEHLALDVAPCVGTWTVREDGSAVRVEFLAPGDRTPLTFALRRKGKTFELIGSGAGYGAGVAGRAAFDALEAKDVVAARAWLRWMKDNLRSDIRPSAQFSVASIFLALRELDIDTAPPSDLRAIALGLVLQDDPKGRVIAAAEALLTKPEIRGDRATWLHSMLGSCYLQVDRNAEAARHFRFVHEAAPDDASYLGYYLGALEAAGESEKARSILEAFLARHPDNERVARNLRSWQIRHGQARKAYEAVAALHAKGKASNSDLNNIAWASLFHADIPRAEALKFALAACEPLQTANGSELHTLASLQGDTGDTNAAYRTAQQMMKSYASGAAPAYLYSVWGVLAERLGMPAAAIAYYDMAIEDDDDDSPTSAAAYCKRRREALGGSRPKTRRGRRSSE